jgi:hypothetical protein
VSRSLSLPFPPQIMSPPPMPYTTSLPAPVENHVDTRRAPDHVIARRAVDVEVAEAELGRTGSSLSRATGSTDATATVDGTAKPRTVHSSSTGSTLQLVCHSCQGAQSVMARPMFTSSTRGYPRRVAGRALQLDQSPLGLDGLHHVETMAAGTGFVPIHRRHSAASDPSAIAAPIPSSISLRTSPSPLRQAAPQRFCVSAMWAMRNSPPATAPRTRARRRRRRRSGRS